MKNGVSTEIVDLISHLVDLIPWSDRRCAMSDVTVSLLEGKHCVAKNVFGWNRSAVEVGLNEFKIGITCIKDISRRLKPAYNFAVHPHDCEDDWLNWSPSSQLSNQLACTYPLI